MSPFDGTGALEARLAAARQVKAEQERVAAAKAAAIQAGVASHVEESSELVREFIARATRLGIQPQHRLPGAVEITRIVGGGIHSERYLDRNMTPCWHLGREPSGLTSKAYPAGYSFDYFLSVSGMNLVLQDTPGREKFAFFKAERMILSTLKWVPRTPHIHDIVMTVGKGDDALQEVTLADAMVTFFLEQEG